MPIMKDFTRQAKVVEFKLDDDIFRGKPHLPAQTMIDFTVAVESIDEKSATPEQGFRTMMDSLQMVLMPESFTRFKQRMQDPEGATEDAAQVITRVLTRLRDLPDDASVTAESIRNLLQPVATKAPAEAGYVPIELDQLPVILEWIMGEYGMRPTQSSADSSDGQSSPASGTNSTDSTSDVELISANSPSTGS
jgi:hypothetical protein